MRLLSLSFLLLAACGGAQEPAQTTPAPEPTSPNVPGPAPQTNLMGSDPIVPFSQTHQGRLEPGDLVLAVDESLYDEYPFSAAAGMTVTVTMTSTDFDTYLHLIGPGEAQLATNDDDDSMGPGPGGQAVNSKLVFIAQTTGDYKVLANAFNQGEVGAYSVTITTTGP